MRPFLRDNAIRYNNSLVCQLDTPFRERGKVYEAWGNKKRRTEVYPTIQSMLERRHKAFTIPVNPSRSLQVRLIPRWTSGSWTCQGIYETSPSLPIRKRAEILASIPGDSSLWNTDNGVLSYIHRIFDFVAAKYGKISFVLSDHGFIGQTLGIDNCTGKLHEIPDLHGMSVDSTNFADVFKALRLHRHAGHEGIVASWMNPGWSYWICRELKKHGVHALPVVMFVLDDKGDVSWNTS